MSYGMTTWRKELAEAMVNANDDGPLIATTLSQEELDLEFDPAYGGEEGVPFTAWSATRVYFPVCYDGAEWAGSVPRNPCDETTAHQGGG